MKNHENTSHLPVNSPWRYKATGVLAAPYLKARGVGVTGLENLPSSHLSYILAVNHRSNLDSIVIGQALLKHDGTQLHFVAKKELMKLPFLGKYIEQSGAIRYDRDLSMSEQPEVNNAMEAVLQNGGVLEMFPERTRRSGPEIQIDRKHRGLGMLAVANSVPIATAGLYGTESAWGRIHLNFGRTVYPGEYDDANSRRRAISIMERDYTDALQDALYGAYELGGADHLINIDQAQDGAS